MSYVEELLEAYKTVAALPWQRNLAPPQRVWTAIYPPEHERRLRLHIRAFESATVAAGHAWDEIDITRSFETWMAAHEYREEYFEEPELLDAAIPAFFGWLIERVRGELADRQNAEAVVALLGAGSLFGLGDGVRVSALVNAVNDAISGRLLVFFPGDHEGNGYRLLDARDGWDYMAVPITPSGSGR
jgi:hypothetical protein